MHINKIQSLAEEIHNNAVEKGFWPEDRNLNEARMLIITELSEAVEAHREDRYANVDSFKEMTGDLIFSNMFKAYIKDTIEDEIADAYIRILDLLYYEWKGDIKKAFNQEKHEGGSVFTKNFAETIYNICKIIMKDLAMGAFMIEIYCRRLDIDLEWHVEQKMKFNSTREEKHGKNY